MELINIQCTLYKELLTASHQQFSSQNLSFRLLHTAHTVYMEELLSLKEKLSTSAIAKKDHGPWQHRAGLML